MDRENKYYNLIAGLVKQHKKYYGLEALLDDIIDDVYAHSEVVLNSIDNENVIQSYLQKIVSTSIITVPKKLNFDNQRHSESNSNSLDIIKNDETVEEEQEDKELEEIASDKQVNLYEPYQKANPEFVDKMINSIQEDTIAEQHFEQEEFENLSEEIAEPDELAELDNLDNIYVDENQEDFDEKQFIDSEQTIDEIPVEYEESAELIDTDSDIENNINDIAEDNDQNEYFQEIVLPEGQGVDFTEEFSDSTSISDDEFDDKSLDIDESDETAFAEEENSTNLDESDDISVLEEQVSNEDISFDGESTDIDETLNAEPATKDEPVYIDESEEGFVSEEEVSNEMEFEILNNQESLQIDNTPDEEIHTLCEDVLQEKDDLGESNDSADDVEYKETQASDNLYDHNDSADEEPLQTFECISEEEPVLEVQNNDEIELESDAISSLDQNPDDFSSLELLSDEHDGDELIVSNDEECVIPDNDEEFEENIEQENSSLEQDITLVEEENINQDNTIFEANEENAEPSILELQNDENELLDINNDSEDFVFEKEESPVLFEGQEELSSSYYFDNISSSTVNDEDAAIVFKDIDYSTFNNIQEKTTEKPDTESIVSKLDEINNIKPELKIKDIYKLKYEQNLTIAEIATTLDMTKREVINAIDNIIEIV